jgi:hypothetical protein
MKYGTLTNKIFANEESAKPEVGNGATLILWSDRHAYTVVEVGENFVLVTRDTAERLDKNFQFGQQKYSYQTDTSATPEKAVLGKDGKYYLAGHVLQVGYRDEYYDYSF